MGNNYTKTIIEAELLLTGESPGIAEVNELNVFLNEQLKKRESYWGDGLLMSEAVTFISGAGKVGKSTFALNLALSLATGKSFLGFEIPQPVKVLFLQQEINEFNLQKRFKKMCNKIKVDNGKFYCATCNLKLDNENDFSRLKSFIEEINPDVVILDPLYKFFLGLDENSSKEVKLLLDKLDMISKQYGVALVIIHHHKKSNGNEKFGSYQMRGSSTLFDYGDSYIILNKDSKDKILRVDFELRNAENPEPLFIKTNKALWFDIVDRY